ncbi:hypothetical protein [Burkholderia sp. BCC0322]|uniref:hypothetical protein n=1 Tax=unclassified Burkholderia TaxID=2613784 RepID=UPI0015894FEC|nr:hypothetical protein [Burkholderia sp. BCC0322]
MKSKSKIVLNAELVYKDLNLKCIEVNKELEEIQRLDSFGNSRMYTVPFNVQYIFSYQWNGKTRMIDVIRKAGNSKPLTTNIRTEIAKQVVEELKEMETMSFTKKGGN